MKINNTPSISFLSTLSILLVFVTLLTMFVCAQENTTDSGMSKFFVIQHGISGLISKINVTAYSLELNDVSDKTILVSDRNDRIVTSVSTSNYIGNWTVGEDSFAVEAPNAVLIVDELEQDITIVELFNPVYDSNTKTLRYEIIPDNVTYFDIQNESFEELSLVIDSTNNKVMSNCIIR